MRQLGSAVQRLDEGADPVDDDAYADEDRQDGYYKFRMQEEHYARDQQDNRSSCEAGTAAAAGYEEGDSFYQAAGADDHGDSHEGAVRPDQEHYAHDQQDDRRPEAVFSLTAHVISFPRTARPGMIF